MASETTPTVTGITTDGADGEEHAPHGGADEPGAGGLAASAGGLTLRPREAIFSVGEREPFEFEITDARGRAVREGYGTTHGRERHLIAVRGDTATFQHAHPRRAFDGTWSTELAFPEPGIYRVFADFELDGHGHTLATDLLVPGEFEPKDLPAPASTGETDGHRIELSGAEQLSAGMEQELSFAVTRGGRPVESLEDYLGAKGHLVALREGDLAYLHVHPIAAEGHRHGGQSRLTHANEVPFAAIFPTAGRYRLFLQFKTDGEVRTVDFTVEVSG